MGRLSRRLSIGSSKSRAQSLNPETGVGSMENPVPLPEQSGEKVGCDNGGEAPVQETEPADGPIIDPNASVSQKRRPSLLTRLRRRSGSVTPAKVENSPANGTIGMMPADVLAAAAIAEAAREGGAAGEDGTNTQSGRESRRSSFSMVAKARAALAQRSKSRASSQESRLYSCAATNVALLPPSPSKHLHEQTTAGNSLSLSAVETNNACLRARISSTQNLTGDGDDEDVGCFTHLPLEDDSLEASREDTVKLCQEPLAVSAAAKLIGDSLEKKEDSAMKQEQEISGGGRALSQNFTPSTAVASRSMVNVENRDQTEDNTQQQPEENGLTKVNEQPKRKLGLNSRKKESRSSGGSTKGESRKDKDPKPQKKDAGNGETVHKKDEDSLRGGARERKPASGWRRRLSSSRERRLSSQSGMTKDKGMEGENKNIFGGESVDGIEAGKPGYLGRIRRRISLSRDQRAGRDESISKKTEVTDDEKGKGIGTDHGGQDPDEFRSVVGTEGELPPRRISGWNRLRRSSISSAVAAVRGRSRDARGAPADGKYEEKHLGQELHKRENTTPSEKQSLATTIRRRLSRSSLRLPRSYSRESSVASRKEEEEGCKSLCGNTDWGAESVAAAQERKTWRRKISDRFRSQSREPPLPSPKRTPSAAALGRGNVAGAEEHNLLCDDRKRSEYGESALELTHASDKRLEEAMERDTAQGQDPESGTQDSYNQTRHRSPRHKQIGAKETLSEELSEPFAVTPETSQAASEQPSSADITPRYREKEDPREKKLCKRAGKPSGSQPERSQSGAALVDEIHRAPGEERREKLEETKLRKDETLMCDGVREFAQWMGQSQEEDEEEDNEEEDNAGFHSERDEEKGHCMQYDSEEERSLRTTPAGGKEKKFATFLCCGNENSDTGDEKEKWKQALLSHRGREGDGVENGRFENRNRRSRVPQPLVCKDLFGDAEVGSAYPLCYAPTDCLLELGLAI